MDLLKLPDITQFIVIFYLDPVSILKLKESCKFFYYFIQNNIHLIHREHRSRNRYIPKILWTPSFYKNFKKVLISFEKSERNKFIEDYSSKGNDEKESILKRIGVYQSILHEIRDENDVVDKYNYLIKKGINNYQSYRLSISNFDDEDLFNYVYLIKNKITYYTSEKIVENSDTVDIQKFLLCVRKGVPYYTSECLAKKFSYTQIDRFFSLLKLGTSIYSAEQMTKDFTDVEISKYKFLIEQKLTPCHAQLTIVHSRRKRRRNYPEYDFFL